MISVKITNSELETNGIWRVPDGRLVDIWAMLPVFVPEECDVLFEWGEHYNLSMDLEQFKQTHRIREVIEIVEVFGEPRNDADSSFKGRIKLVARFDSITDAIMFKLWL